MKPVLVRVIGMTYPVLLIGFSTESNEAVGIVCWPDGGLGVIPVVDITIERPNEDFPVGYGSWSRVEAEQS